jgi:hypothetical protein
MRCMASRQSRAWKGASTIGGAFAKSMLRAISSPMAALPEISLTASQKAPDSSIVSESVSSKLATFSLACRATSAGEIPTAATDAHIDGNSFRRVATAIVSIVSPGASVMWARLGVALPVITSETRQPACRIRQSFAMSPRPSGLFMYRPLRKGPTLIRLAQGCQVI